MLNKAIEFIKNSKSITVLTGAGMSVPSGLKDFRSNNGMWNDKDPMKYSHIKTLRLHPETVINFYIDTVKEILKHKPNKGHYILSKWQEKGIIQNIITQNIDMYHTESGSKNVIELHGNRNFRTWLGNEVISAEEFIKMDRIHEFWITDYEGHEDIYRPNVVLFGEQLDNYVLYKAQNACLKSDLCIVLGSSLSVYPANQLPEFTLGSGGKLIIVDKGETEVDAKADIKLNMDIVEFLKKVDKEL
mgnify:FL=1|jgi:NAD-dependent protein deacetylases, SIR2 family